MSTKQLVYTVLAVMLALFVWETFGARLTAKVAV
jgi:hypothetical protein